MLIVAGKIGPEEHLGHRHSASQAHHVCPLESSIHAPTSRKPCLTSPRPSLEILHEGSDWSLLRPGCLALTRHHFRTAAPF